MSALVSCASLLAACAQHLTQGSRHTIPLHTARKPGSHAPSIARGCIISPSRTAAGFQPLKAVRSNTPPAAASSCSVIDAIQTAVTVADSMRSFREPSYAARTPMTDVREVHLQDVRAAATDDHLDATLVERLRQGLADPRAAAGDVRHFRRECHR